METLAAGFKRDPKLQTILSAPTLTAEDKKQIVAEIQKSTGVQDKTNTIQGFLDTLAENNRLNVLEGVSEKFAQLVSAARGEVELTITSAQPLDNKVVKQLEAAVSKSQYVGQGKKLKVVPKVSTKDETTAQSELSLTGYRLTRTSVAALLWRSVTEPSTSACHPRSRN